MHRFSNKQTHILGSVANRINSYIIDKAFKTFLTASILTGLVQQLRILADGVIVSHIIGPSALAAINLYIPLEELFYALIMMVVSGAGFLAAIELGKQNYRQVSEFFSSALFHTLTIVAILVTGCYLFLPQVIGALSDAEEVELFSLTKDYTRIMLLTFLIQVPNSALRAFVCVDGKPRLVTISIIVSFVFNILLAMLFVAGLHLGIEGAAWATLTSDTLGMLILLPYIFTQKCSFRIVPPFSLKTLGRSLRQGIPLQVPQTLNAAALLIINQLILEFKGPEGEYLFAVGMQILLLGTMMLEGVVELNESIGGVLLGERDFSAFRKIVKNSYAVIVGIAIIIVTITLIWPEHVLSVFGEGGESMSSNLPNDLRCISCSFIPYMIFLFTANIHILVGKDRLATSFQFIQSGIQISSLVVFGYWFVDYFWWAMTAEITIVLLLQMVAAWTIHRRKCMATSYALLPLVPDDIAVVHSVRYTQQSIEENLQNIRNFIEICELNSDISNRVMICCEELMYNLLAFSADKHEKHAFDLRLSDQEDCFEVRIKDAGKPFNPVISFEQTAAEAYQSGTQLQLGLRLVNSLCEDISHKYMFGLNVTTLKFGKSNN